MGIDDETIPNSVSLLFVPGDRPDRFEKAAASGADGVIIDLEDSVAAGSKSAARVALSTCLREKRAGATGVRLSGSSVDAMGTDLILLAEAKTPPDFVMVPGVESAEDVMTLREAYRDRFQSEPVFICLVETARGVLAAADIAEVADALMIGEADLAADLGCSPVSEALRTSAALVLLAAAAARVPVFASPDFSVSDNDAVARRCRRDVEDGYSGKGAIHPNQIPLISAAFHPDARAVSWAGRVLDALEGAGVGTVDGAMVDEAMARRARRIVQRAAKRHID